MQQNSGFLFDSKKEILSSMIQCWELGMLTYGNYLSNHKGILSASQAGGKHCEAWWLRPSNQMCFQTRGSRCTWCARHLLMKSAIPVLYLLQIKTNVHLSHDNQTIGIKPYLYLLAQLLFRQWVTRKNVLILGGVWCDPCCSRLSRC